jgi:hypothetical protein
LLEEDDKMKKELAERRLENIHQWLVREINVGKMIGYNLYWKILWANKISWDAFGIEETKDKYIFFIWDATGHWIKAWFIITLLNKLFNINYAKPFTELVFEINNQLKQSLESRNFITWVFFEIDKKTNKVSYVWMWHEPMLVYRSKTKTIERVIPGGLAIWIQRIENKELVRVKELKMENGDILMCYSDWLIEAKNIDGEFYGLERLKEIFTIATKNETNINRIYDIVTKDVKLFRWWSSFDDDLTIILLEREEENDLVIKWDDYIKEIQVKQWLNERELREIEWKTRKEAWEKSEEIKKKKEIKRIITNLKNLYYTWEMLQLKEEASRYIKEWFIDKKINFYLKKAMENEAKYRIGLKEQKMQSKYKVLTTLYEKWDYETIINEIEDLISKDGNI